MQANVTLRWTTQMLRIFKEDSQETTWIGNNDFLNLKNRYDDSIGVYRFWLDIYLGDTPARGRVYWLYINLRPRSYLIFGLPP